MADNREKHRLPDTLENLVRDFIKANWSITEQVIGANPAITTVLSRQAQTQVDNFAYDNFRTYYIRVKEVASEVRNRQIRLNTYEFATPIELELYSRRLKKGEAFPELNNMLNELLPYVRHIPERPDIRSRRYNTG